MALRHVCRRTSPRALAIAAGVLLGGMACARGDQAASGPALVMTTIERADAPPKYDISSLPFVDERRLVESIAQPDHPGFFVLARTPRLTKAPCSNCHTVPAASMRWSGADGKARAHWSINLQHASAQVMTCATCHTPDSPGTLRTLTGAPVGIDHAYQVCAQCHSRQADDWTGGAHGKRAGGWAPPRVVYSCSECHDPHRTAFASRWPARAGRTPREVSRR